MTPKELAQNFVCQFDKLNNDEKSVCLNEIARVFKHRYPIWLRCEIEANTHSDDGYFEDLQFDMSETNITIHWDENAWSVFGVNNN